MHTKIREIIIEARNPEHGFCINATLDILHKKALIIDDENADPLFPKKQITRADLNKWEAALSLMKSTMDVYFGEEGFVMGPDRTISQLEKPKEPLTQPKKKKQSSQKETDQVDKLQSDEHKTSNGKYTRVCKFCGKEFQTKRPQAMICGSKDCIREYNREYAKNKQKSNQQG